jgi:predicted nucleotidyltransferase component of viral defense system
VSNATQLKARMKILAARYHIPAQAVLQNYMLERLLERISISKYRDNVILKGGMLIASLVGISSRTTMDMDTTLKSHPLSEEGIERSFSEICAIPLDDGTAFQLDHVEPIRSDDEYGGFRVKLLAVYESIRTPLKVDVTTGDALTPGAIRYAFPSSFEDKLIEVWAYNIETILAEKVETILRRSVLNTRPRDFYDVFIIVKTQGHVFDQSLFVKALEATSNNRMSLDALADRNRILGMIRSDVTMRQRWERYCAENYYAQGIVFDEVLDILATIVN